MVLTNVIENVAFAICILGVIYLIYYMFHSSLGYGRKKGDLFVTYYTVRFRGVPIPDLKANEKIMAKLNSQQKLDNGYLVESIVNGGSIKQLLKEEYGYTDKELLIQSAKNALQS